MHSNDTVDEMVIFGGRSTHAEYNDIWRLSLATMEWKTDNTSGTAPPVRAEATIIAYQNRFILFGGISYATLLPRVYNDIWSYDLVQCVWKEIIPSSTNDPSPRASHSAGYIFDGIGTPYLLVFSGRHFDGSDWILLNDLWLFAINTNEWLSVDMSLSLGRAYTSLIITRDTHMWFCGGCEGLGNNGQCGEVTQSFNKGRVDFYNSPLVPAQTTMFEQIWCQSCGKACTQCYYPGACIDNRAVS